MSLPIAWVDRIFDKLTLVYGQAFLRKWDAIDMNAVKSDWAHELSGFEGHPKAIAWALQNLSPEKAPNALEFKFLARRAPPDELPRLEAPKADPDRIAEELAKLAPVLAKPLARPNTDWAHVIVARADAGERIAPAVLRMAREVVGRRMEPTFNYVEGQG
jgi:hypothetical protein